MTCHTFDRFGEPLQQISDKLEALLLGKDSAEKLFFEGLPKIS